MANLDYWGDGDQSTNGGSKKGDINGGLYYYLISEELLNTYCDDITKAKNTIVVPPVDAVHSVVFNPYIDEKDLITVDIPYDKKRFPLKGLSDEDIDVISNVRRIEWIYIQSKGEKSISGIKQLGTFKCYKPSKSIGGARNWRNESKLYNFPYSYGMLFDGIASPYQFKYHLCKNNDVNVKTHLSINNTGTYDYFIENYKNDEIGLTERNVNEKSTQMPVLSNAYSNFMATSQAGLSAQKNVNESNFLMGTGSALLGGVSQAMTGAIGGAMMGSAVPGVGTLVGAGVGLATGLATGLTGNYINYQNQNKLLNAQESDLRTTPAIINNMGSDVIYNKASGNGHLNLIRIGLKEEYLQRIGDYFAMYGYKQDKILTINTRSRFYYNYIKTSSINIKSHGIPKDHLNKLKSIYNNGTTIWHGYNNVTMCDYSNDNREV